jgi:hypothetical protein
MHGRRRPGGHIRGPAEDKRFQPHLPAGEGSGRGDKIEAGTRPHLACASQLQAAPSPLHLTQAVVDDLEEASNEVMLVDEDEVRPR